MKTCGYCGKTSPDDAVNCSGCGQPLHVPLPPSPTPVHSGRPPRPEAHSIILREYANETAAERALDALRTARIEAFIAADNLGGMFPPLNAMYPFRLIVSEVHREAAERVLAEMEPTPVIQSTSAAGSIKSVAPSSTSSSSGRPLIVFVLGAIAGALVLLGYQQAREHFSGTVRRDFNHDGRTDAWDTYKNGKHVRFAMDYNDDERPDVWYDYEDDVMTRWEEDVNFDGKVDAWGTCDGLGRYKQTKFDLDFDGTPETIAYYQHGRIREQHSVVPQSGLVWKKRFFTNDILREDLIDRNRDGKFDERLLFDIHGVEVKKEPLP